MRLFKIVCFAILAIVLLIFAASWLFMRWQSPKLNGEIIVSGLQSETQVYYDVYGIPHIMAGSASDAYFALGYVHAQDRLFQMDLLRRVGGGRLSEFFGSKVVDVDKLFHTLGVPKYSADAAAGFDRQPDELKEAVHAYLAGVNEFVNNGKTPMEYFIAGLPKEEFTVVDLYQTAGYMAFSFAIGLRSDPLTENIYRQWGGEHLNDLAVRYYNGQALAPVFGNSAAPQVSAALIKSIDELNVPLFFGSNNWVVAGSKTKSGKPIFANDTHIKFAQPSVWYESHLSYPGTSLYGNFLPGIPFALIGNNQFSAWGLTMLENDDTDFYYEQLSDDKQKVRYLDSLWVDIEVAEIEIKVKGEPSINFQIRKTPHGPLINDFFESKISQPVSMFWTYTKKENNLPKAFYALNHARSIEESRAAVALIHAPGLNVAYADTMGNIALWASAHLLNRAEHINPKLVLDGASGKDELLGYYPFSTNPQSENPPSGMVFSANSQHDSTGLGVLHDGYYTTTVRMERIAELLNDSQLFDVEMMQKIVSDHYSMSDHEIAEIVLSVLEKSSDDSLNDYIKILRLWDGGHTKDDKGPVAYYPLLFHLVKNTFKDELGPENFEVFLGTHLMKRSYHKIFKMKASVWYDDVSTPKVENRDDIFLLSAKMALEQLIAQNGSLDNIPVWGDVHTIEFAHAMGTQKPLDKIFNIGPFATSGANESIDQQSFRLTDSGFYPVQHGPQMRILIDLADFENSISINPTGQSGNRGSKHYANQAEMFVNHQFRKQMMSKTEIMETSPNVLILVPKN
jgi:penicillin G amidase